MVVFSKYELIFLRLNLGMEKEESLIRYAKFSILRYAGLRLRKLEHMLSIHTADIMHIQTKADVDKICAKKVIYKQFVKSIKL